MADDATPQWSLESLTKAYQQGYMAGLTGHTTAAGVHRGNQLEIGGVRHPVIGARDDAFAALERLAQAGGDGAGGLCRSWGLGGLAGP